MSKTIEELQAAWEAACAKRTELRAKHAEASAVADALFQDWMRAGEESEAAFDALFDAQKAAMQTPKGDA